MKGCPNRFVVALVLPVLLTSSIVLAATPPPASETPAASGRWMNLTMAPIGLLFGSFNAGVGLKLGSSLVLSPNASFSSYSSGTSEASSVGFGLEIPVFLSAPALESSWVLVPSVSYASATSGNLSASGIAAGADLGYWWFFDGGFNMSTGLGVQYIGLDFSKIGLANISAVLPSVMFKLGYSF